ncbi:MAG: cell surface protein SprA [Candidatus Delongbacteria bacterium]|nr:cell surface protein SprA [Candidatus Delongbacteria bacterium]
MKLRSVLNILMFILVLDLFSIQNSDSTSFKLIYDTGILKNQVEVFPPVGQNFLTKYKKDSIVFSISSTKYKHGIEIDESMQYVVIYERLFEEDYKKSIVMKLQDYISQRTEYETRDQWFKSVTKGLGVGEYGGFLSGEEIAIDIPFKIKSRTFHRVFGGDKIGLRVKGSLSLSITGQKSYTDLPNVEDSSFDFTLDQTQNISIRGKIGTKVDVDIAQNTESLDFENSLKLTYTGESDEIIQKFEAGNIGLSLPGTRFVSYSGVNKGLFGLKTVMQIGNLKNTTIASFEKGQKNQLTVKGGVTTREVSINAKNYLPYTYFYIEDSFKENFATENNYENILAHVPLSTSIYKIQPYSLELFVTIGNEVGTFPDADIYIDYTDNSDSIGVYPNSYPNLYKQNRVKRLEPEQYEINNELGYIRLKSVNLVSGQILAVKYIKQHYQLLTDTIHIGKKVSDTKYELQIIAEKGQKFSAPWSDLEWKNVYSLGGTDVSREDFKLTITKDVAGTTKSEELDPSGVPVPYLQWYEVEDEQANDLVDIGYLNPAYGEFRFPNQRPFEPDSNSVIYKTTGLADTLFTDPEIYQDPYTTFTSPFNLKFVITSKSSTYQLGFNVIEGSEVVRSGATELQKDVDYIIDYHSGQLSLINDLYQTADIEISYESATIFQLDEKVLLGNRFEYSFNKDTYIGGTVLYLSESTNEERVHVGYEPKRNLTLDINGQTKFDTPFITKMLDRLPLIETDSKSSFSLEGEVAQIYPNPNPLDAAYIDDFENSKKNTSLGINYSSWHYSSVPDYYETLVSYTQSTDVTGDGLILPTSYFLQAYSGNSETDEPAFYWYNPNDDDKLAKDDIYTDVPATEKNDKVSTLDMIFKPMNRSEGINGNDIRPEDSWGGVMKYLHSSYQDMREIKYIEFLASTNRNITLNIDIGELSEDVIPDGYLNTEDINNNNVLDIVDNSEDTGLDMMSGQNDFNPLYLFDPNSPRAKENYERFSFDDHPEESAGKPTPDSQLDNYWDFIKTEKNGRLDSEDLDGGGNLDKTVKAYRYSLELRSNPTVDLNYVISKDYSPGSGFALYRVPLDDKLRKILNSEPDLAKMKYLKLWVNNSADTINTTKIQFVTLNLVGNEWAARGDSKGRIEAKTINNEDDKERYHSPPGVKKLDSDNYEVPEQSLLMDITLDPFSTSNLPKNPTLTKYLIGGENYLLYEEMKMFIHGGTEKDDPLWPVDRPLYFVYRFGSDSLNYYEYRSKLVAGWKNTEVNNQMIIPLNELTELKTLRSDDGARIDSMYMKGFNDELIKRYIGIRGNPTLQNVKYLNAGIIDSANTALNTEIWLDELRLVKVKKDPGMAMRAKSRIELADVATVDMEMTRQDGNFHRIEEKSGSGLNSQNFNLNTTFNLDKLVPQKLGLRVPLKYTYSNSDSYTKYQGSTDILVDENNIPDSVRIINKRHQYDFSVNKTSKSTNPFLKYSIDNISFTGNASFSNLSNATYLTSESENYKYKIGYSLNLPESWFSLKPFGWVGANSFMKGMKDFKFVFFPSSYTTNLETTKNKTVSLTRKGNNTTSQLFDVTRSFNTKMSPIPILNTSYDLTLRSDMFKTKIDTIDTNSGETVTLVVDDKTRDFSDIASFNFGELSTLDSKLNNNLNLNFFKFWTNDLSFNTAYSWNGNLANNSMGTDIKNRYDAKIGTKLKTKDIFTGIQSSIEYFFPKKEEKKETVQHNDDPAPPQKNDPKDVKKTDNMRNIRKSKSSNSEKKKSILDFLKNNLSDLSLSYSQNRENTFNNINSFDQADLGFIFGVSSEPEDLEYENTSWGGSWALSGSTRLSLSNNLAFDGITYQFGRSYRENNNEGFAGTDTETNFVWPWVTEEEHKKSDVTSYMIPNYSINIKGLEKLMINSESISSITISHQKSGNVSSVWYMENSSPDMYLTGIPDLDPNILKLRSKAYNVSFRPLASFKLNLKNGYNFSASYNYTYDMKEQYAYNDGVADIQSGDKKYSRELRVSSGYNQKGGFKIPLNFWPFNGKRLDNDITYNLSLSYNSSETYKYDLEAKEYEGFADGIKSDNFTVAPDITYKISQKLSGTASYSYNYNESQSYGARSVVNTNHKFELRAVLSISGR